MKKSILVLCLLALFSLASYAQDYRSPHVFYESGKGQKAISITVDDCNNPSLVEKMLAIAEKYGIRLTFFPTGKNVLSQKNLWQKVHGLGHDIELHTFTHRKMNCDRETQAEEIIKNISAIRSVLGKDIVFSFLRLPYGIGLERKNLADLLYALREASRYNGGPLDIAMWGTDLLFIKGKLSNSDEAFAEFKGNLKPGNTFLFHARKEELVYFEEMVAKASREGYAMVSIKQMFSQEIEYLARKDKDGQKKECVSELESKSSAM